MENTSTNLRRNEKHNQVTLNSVCRFGHVWGCFDYEWSWANPFSTELESHKKNRFLSFEPQLSGVQLELLLLHSQQKIVKIFIMIFLSLLLCLSTSINKNIVNNVADIFQSCKGFLLSRLILLGSTWDSVRQTKPPVPAKSSMECCDQAWLVIEKYVGETRHRICNWKTLCTVLLGQDVLEAGNWMLGDSYCLVKSVWWVKKDSKFVLCLFYRHITAPSCWLILSANLFFAFHLV